MIRTEGRGNQHRVGKDATGSRFYREMASTLSRDVFDFEVYGPRRYFNGHLFSLFRG
jgi:hypothetical protein